MSIVFYIEAIVEAGQTHSRLVTWVSRESAKLDAFFEVLKVNYIYILQVSFIFQ